MGGLHRSLSRTDFALRSLPAGQRALPALLSVLRTNRADGVVLDRLVPGDDRVALLADHDFPFVTLGAEGAMPVHAYLRIDEAGAARGLTASLLAEGRRKIVLVDDGARLIDSAARLDGHHRALADAGVAAMPLLCPPRPDLAAEVAHLVRSGQADAFVCGADAYLLAIMTGLTHAGAAGNGIGLALRSARSQPALLPRPMHVAWFPAERAGAILADLLVARIAGEPIEALQRDVPVEFLPPAA